MKNILIILPYFPYPLNSGGNIAVFEMIDFLRFKHNITVIVPQTIVSNKISLKQKWNNVDIITYRNDSILRKLTIKFSKLLFHFYLKFLSFILIKNFKVSKFLTNSLYPYYNKSIIDKTNDILSKKSFDFVQIEFYELLPLIKYINHHNNTIFIHHELRYVRFNRTMEENTFNNLMLDIIKGQEIELLKHYSKIITVSETDKNILSKDIYTNKIIASPLTIRLSPLKHYNEFIFNNTLTYLGGSAHFPNKDAIDWFLNNCWEEIQKCTSIKLNIIGLWTKKEISYYSKFKNVNFLGFVDNLEQTLSNSIMIVPIRIGSGMRMKIIEAANYGVPFITTSIGVEGLEFENNKDCIVADDKKTFINAIIQLSVDDEKQKFLIQNARRIIETKYNSNMIFEKRNSIYFN